MALPKRKKTLRGKQMNPTRLIALTFVGIILLGACLLTLPAASRDGVSCGFRPALFTATSSTCVTGLVLYDTWTQWSSFGQVVIICLIEIGGLGFMSAASLVIFLFRRKVGLKQRMVMAQALSVDDMQSVVKLQKWVLLGSLSIQAVGALVLFLRFLPEFGLPKAAAWGVFHAISAFCNAGFDIFGYIEPGQSVAVFNHDPVVCITLMMLIILGSLGFFVWEEMARVHRFKKFSVYTKLVLLATGVLLVGGALLILILEWSNPATLGQMPVWQKVLNSFFQSTTLRTAGFASFDQGGLTDGGKAVSMFLMLIGGSSGSTAGGMKTVTFLVIMLFVVTRLRGRSHVTVFKRSILPEKVMDAMMIAFVMIGLSLFGAVVICTTSPISFTDGLYESVSALATVGVTTGVTTSLSIPAQLLMILFMYFGRVGILTISLGFLMSDRAEERFQYAHTNLLIG